MYQQKNGQSTAYPSPSTQRTRERAAQIGKYILFFSITYDRSSRSAHIIVVVVVAGQLEALCTEFHHLVGANKPKQWCGIFRPPKSRFTSHILAAVNDLLDDGGATAAAIWEFLVSDDDG